MTIEQAEDILHAMELANKQIKEIVNDRTNITAN